MRAVARSCSTGRRQIARRINKRAWELALLAYENLRVTIIDDLEAGRIDDEQIEMWAPEQPTQRGDSAAHNVPLR